MFKKDNFFLYLITAMMAYIFFFLAPFNTNDFYLHYPMGEYIWNNGIPNTGVLSWYGENLPWVAHEWAFEILTYFIGQFLTINQFAIICYFITVGFIFHILNKHSEEIKNHFLMSTVYTICLIYTMSGLICFRPFLFSFLLFTIEMNLIYQAYEGKTDKLNYLPAIAILWSNFHGGSSSLAYFLPIGFLVFLLLPYKKLNFTRKPLPKGIIKKLKIIIPMTMLCILINPFGLDMFLYPYINMTDTTMLSLIEEWFPLNITNPVHQQLCFPIMGVVLFSLLTSDKKDIVDIGFCIVFTLMTFKCCRFIGYFALFSGFLIKYFPAWHITQTKNAKHNLKLTGFVILILTILTIYNVYKGTFLVAEMPYKNTLVYEAILRENPQRIYTFESFGAELLGTGVKPFNDARADVYTKHIWKDCINLSFLKADPEPIIEKYNFDYLVTKQSEPIYWYLKKHSDKYQLIEEDNLSALFKNLDYVEK